MAKIDGGSSAFDKLHEYLSQAEEGAHKAVSAVQKEADAMASKAKKAAASVDQWPGPSESLQALIDQTAASVVAEFVKNTTANAKKVAHAANEGVDQVAQGVKEYKSGAHEAGIDDIKEAVTGLVRAPFDRVKVTTNEVLAHPKDYVGVVLGGVTNPAGLAVPYVVAEGRHQLAELKEKAAKEGGGAKGLLVAAHQQWDPLAGVIDHSREAKNAIAARDWHKTGAEVTHTIGAIANTVALLEGAKGLATGVGTRAVASRAASAAEGAAARAASVAKAEGAAAREAGAEMRAKAGNAASKASVEPHLSVASKSTLPKSPVNANPGSPVYTPKLSAKQLERFCDLRDAGYTNKPEPVGNRKPTIKYDSNLKPNELGNTNKVTGNIKIRPGLTPIEEDLTLIHEYVHSKLSPSMLSTKWISKERLQRLREFRGVKGFHVYQNSALCQYLEEALAESYAQVKVNGIRALPEGLKFPINKDYVTLKSVVTEAAIGTITYAGMQYGVYLVLKDDENEPTPEKEKKP